MQRKSFLKYIITILVALDVIVWYFILFPKHLNNFELYFLSVGQGDSSLVLLANKNNDFVKILIDGGPINGGIMNDLSQILGMNRYIDLVMISHPQIDHYGGLIDVVKNYKVGAVLYNGEEGSGNNWIEFNKYIEQNKIIKLALNRGEEINYVDSSIEVLNSFNFSANTNNAALVLLLNTDGIRALFTGDIDGAAELDLSKKYDLSADILKVSHHGSKYSSNINFLKEVNPKISVIEVGKNSYGHPAKPVLERLISVGSKVFNTYEQGMIKIIREESNLKVFSYPEPDLL